MPLALREPSISVIKEWHQRYERTWNEVCQEAEGEPDWFMGVNLRVCQRIKDFQAAMDINHPLVRNQQERHSWFPKKLSVGRVNRAITAIWKGSRHLEESPTERRVIISDSTSPRLLLTAIVNDMAYWQMNGRDLRAFIVECHVFFKKAQKLAFLVLDEDISPNKNAMVQVAHQYGVTSFVRLHGNLGLRNGFAPLTANYIMVNYLGQKNKLIKWGVPHGRVLVERLV